MKNIIEMLAEKLTPFAEHLESQLKEKYAIRDVTVEIGSRYDTYVLHCWNAIDGEFISARGDCWADTLKSFEKQLVSLDSIKDAKIKRAKQLMKEAEAL